MDLQLDDHADPVEHEERREEDRKEEREGNTPSTPPP